MINFIISLYFVFRAELALIKNMSGSYEYRGTYVHPDLIPSIASWISPAF
jgi:KilA-N domain